jgi:T-lymphoma invasion and metastasis-inducing protein 1
VSDPSRTDLHALLDARNPGQEQSRTFASYLIKPVQRVLKYPLLLREMCAHLEHDKVAQKAVKASLGDLTRLASHINDMTKLTDMFEAELQAHVPGMMLSQLFHTLLHHSSMVWCNCLDDRLKPRRQVSPWHSDWCHACMRI